MLRLSKQKKYLILTLSGIALLSFLFAYFYYRGENKAVDPRIVHTRYLLKQYDQLISENRHVETFPLLDTIDGVFRNVPGYRDSYERGIVFNNRGSALLSMALYHEKDSTAKQQLLTSAAENFDTCILIYRKWLDKFRKMDHEKLEAEVLAHFRPEDPAFKGYNYRRILNKRIDELKSAQKENERRLSVAYTNLGIVQRHRFQQDSAMQSYIRAIELWKDNFTARNNFNVLMGLDPEDRSIIEKLFPPDKNK